jgi:histidinol dehydrogenase
VTDSLQTRGALIHTSNLLQALDLVNKIAPEHLELSFENAADYVDKIHNAGAVFVGRYAAEALGDYVAGPNHVLPTAGTARFASPLGVYDFQKRSSIIDCTAEGASKLAKSAEILALSEGLDAHARSAAYRIITDD